MKLYMLIAQGILLFITNIDTRLTATILGWDLNSLAPWSLDAFQNNFPSHKPANEKSAKGVKIFIQRGFILVKE